MKHWWDWLAMVFMSFLAIGFASMVCGYFVLTRSALRTTDAAERRLRLRQLYCTFRGVHRPWMDARGLLLVVLGAALGGGALLAFGAFMVAFSLLI